MKEFIKRVFLSKMNIIFGIIVCLITILKCVMICEANQIPKACLKSIIFYFVVVIGYEAVFGKLSKGRKGGSE